MPRRILDSYKQAVFNKDLPAYLALYSEDAIIFDMWGPAWDFGGPAAWREVTEEWFASLGPDSVRVDFFHVHEQSEGALAVISAFVRYTAVSPEGKTLRAMDNRLSLVLAGHNGGWKIVHQHTSAPLDGTSMKVSLERMEG